MHDSFSSRTFRAKVLCVILVPLILGAMLTTWVAVVSSEQLLDARAKQFGGAIADQLSASIADQLVQPDVLGLNVTLNNLLDKGDFSFASVYSADNKLLAQAGKNTGNLMMFTREVVFQNAAAGTLQIGLDPQLVDAPTMTILFTSLLVPLIFIAMITLFGWSYADFVYLWLTAPGAQHEFIEPEPEEPPDSSDDNEEEEEVPEVEDRVTLLVIKLRPTRLVETYEPIVLRALALHRGSPKLTPGKDFVVAFHTHAQVVDAIRAALLVKSLLQLSKDHLTVKLGLHTTMNADEFDKATKHATYLASISDNLLLASKAVFEVLGESEQVTLQAFHSSLTPDGEVYFVDSLNGQNQELIQRQAKQLFEN